MPPWVHYLLIPGYLLVGVASALFWCLLLWLGITVLGQVLVGMADALGRLVAPRPVLKRGR